MKFFPHNKQVGVVFFSLLIITALLLFVSDLLTTSSPQNKQSSASTPEAINYDKSSASRSLTSTASTSEFKQVDWQSSLSTVGVDIKETGSAGLNKGYSPNALTRIQNPTTLDFNNYIENLTAALHRYTDPKFGNEVSIMTKAVESKNETLLIALDGYIDTHTSSIADLTATPVPAVLAPYQLDMINALTQIVKLDGMMKNVLTETNIAIVSAQTYPGEKAKFYRAFEGIKTVLSSKKIAMPSFKIYLGAGISK